MKNTRIGFTALLVVVLLAAACTSKKKQPVVEQAKSESKYTCPMHPQIEEDHPGNCPICGMTLVKKSGQVTEKTAISLHTVLQPVEHAVIASVNAIQPEQKEVATTTTANGYLDYDTRTFNSVAARISGRIEKVYVKYAFQQISLGERLFDIYSPDLVTAQQDLIYLHANSPQEIGLISAAKQKLQLLGLTESQIAQVLRTAKPYYSLPVYSPYAGHVHNMPHSQMSGITYAAEGFSTSLPLAIKEGMYVEKGQTLFNVVDPHHLWAILKIDRSAAARIKLNQEVTISLPDQPEKTLSGKVNFIEPVYQEGDKNTSIRVYLHNPDHQLKVNSLVEATIQTGKTTALWIPRAALLDLGHTKMVWLKKGDLYTAHQVSSGVINGDQVQIISGLSATDQLASDAQYLADSESFIQTKENEK